MLFSHKTLCISNSTSPSASWRAHPQKVKLFYPYTNPDSRLSKNTHSFCVSLSPVWLRLVWVHVCSWVCTHKDTWEGGGQRLVSAVSLCCSCFWDRFSQWIWLSLRHLGWLTNGLQMSVSLHHHSWNYRYTALCPAACGCLGSELWSSRVTKISPLAPILLATKGKTELRASLYSYN